MNQMAEMSSRNHKRSHSGLEAFQVGLEIDQKGKKWKYKANGAITGIMIKMNANVIGSLFFQSVDEKGNIEYSDTFGSYNTDSNVFKIAFGPQEYLTSLGGETCTGLSHSQFYISSIYFETNKRKHGPFPTSNTQGKGLFKFPLTGKMIVGFYGRESGKDDLGGRICGGLGVYVKDSSQVQVATPKTKLVGSFKQEECIKVGPWGWSRSLKEKEWTYMLEGKTQIQISYNENYIVSISFKASNANGDPFIYSRNSGSRVEKQEAITLNFPDEYLVSISGTTRSSNKDIESLCFYTNKRIYGPFGPMKGNCFRFYIKGGVVGGFHGRVGNFFDALGVYIKSFSEFSGEGNNDNTEKVGPIGLQRGKEWDYKPNCAITEITICHGSLIHSLRFKSVDKNDGHKYSGTFGREGGKKSKVKINWPNEYLTSISGTYNTSENQQVIESLSFHTNRTTYGPFGGKGGISFNTSLKDGDIVGFHGRASNYLDAIGVYRKSRVHADNAISISPIARIS